MVDLMDDFISPSLVWIIFFMTTFIGFLAILLLRYHWNKYLFGGEFIRFGIIKGIFLGVILILWVALLIIAISFSVLF